MSARCAGSIPFATAAAGLSLTSRITARPWSGFTIEKPWERYLGTIGHLPKQLDLVPGEGPAFAAGEPLDADGAYGNAVQGHDLVPELGQHPANLAVLSFGQYELEHLGLALAADESARLARILPSESQTPAVSLARTS